MLSDYFALAFKNLKHRGARSWLTLLGIFIGVAAVVSLISLGNALQVAVSSQFGVSQTELITIQAGGVTSGPPGSGVVTHLNIDDLKAIEKLGGVKRAAGRYIAPGKLEYNDKIAFSYVINIPPGENRDFVYEQLDEEAIVGRLLKGDESGKVFLGYNFYVDKAGLEKKIIPGKNVLINDKSFEVVGILDKKGSFMFDGAIYMNDKDMQDLYDYGDDFDVIILQLKDNNEIEKWTTEIKKVLRKTRDVKEGEEDFKISNPESTMATVKGILGGVKAFIIIVALISVFIGALGIVNTMTTSVLERKKEIGIMKSIGARNDHIFMQFFVESGLLGFFGGLIGVIVGSLIGYLGTMGVNNFVGVNIKPTINFALIFFTLLGSFLIGAIAGIVPAMNASKENPVEALRG